MELRCAAHKDELSALRLKFFKSVKRRGAQSFAVGDDNNIIFHFADAKGSAALAALLRQKRLAYEIKINRTEEQPFCQVLKFFVKLTAHQPRFVVGTPVQPIAFNGVYNADADNGCTPCHSGVDTCEMILNAGIFLVPRGLIAYRGGIVTFRLAGHGDP